MVVTESANATGWAIKIGQGLGIGANVAVPIGAGLLVGAVILGGYFLSKDGKKKQPGEPIDFSFKEIEALSIPTETPIVNKRIIVGETTVAGAKIFAESKGGYVVNGYALAAHELEDVMSLTIDGIRYSTDELGYVNAFPYYDPRVFVNYSVQPQNWETHAALETAIFEPRNYLRASFRLGTLDQQKDQLVHHRFPEIARSFRQIGTATAFLEYYRGGRDTAPRRHYRERPVGDGQFEHDKVWGSNGRPPEPLFTVRGLKCYDPRTQKTEWTRNAALIAAAVLVNDTMSKRNGLDYDDLDLPALKQAADACDEGFEIAPNNQYPRGAVFKKFTLDGAIRTSESLVSVLEGMFVCSRMRLGWRQNKYNLGVSGPRPVVLNLTDRDFQGNVSSELSKRMSEKSNTIRAQYRDADGDGNLVDAPVYKVDDGQVRDINQVYRFLTNTYRAQYLMQTALNELQLERVVSCVVGMRAYAVEVLDRVSIDSVKQPELNGTYIVGQVEMNQDATQIKLILTEFDWSEIDKWVPGESETVDDHTIPVHIKEVSVADAVIRQILSNTPSGASGEQ